MNLQSLVWLLLGGAFLACERRPGAERPRPAPAAPLPAQMAAQDSGFLTKRDGLPWLLKLGVADTTDSLARATWRLVAPTDTIGKYYRTARTGNTLVLCEVETGVFPDENHWLLEIAPDGRLRQRQRYFLGKYACTGGNFLAGFRQAGTWFLLGSNNTGTAFCTGFVSIFDRALPPKDGHRILTYLADDAGQRLATRLTARTEFRHDTLLAHYAERQWSPHRGAATTAYDIRYVRHDSGWRALDSARLRPLLPMLE